MSFEFQTRYIPTGLIPPCCSQVEKEAVLGRGGGDLEVTNSNMNLMAGQGKYQFLSSFEDWKQSDCFLCCLACIHVGVIGKGRERGKTERREGRGANLYGHSDERY